MTKLFGHYRALHTPDRQPRSATRPLQGRSVLGDALRRALRTSPTKPLVIDLLGVNPPPKLSMAVDFVDALQRASHREIYFINATPQLFAAMQQPLVARSARLRALQIVPVILKDGAWKWLGSSHPTIDSALERSLLQQVYPNNERPTAFPDDTPTREVLEALCSANPHLLSGLDSRGELRLTTSALDLLDFIQASERPRLLQQIENSGLVRKGHFVLPSGLHTDFAVDMSTVPTLEELFSQLVSQVARYVWLTRPDYVFTGSFVSFAIAERLAGEVRAPSLKAVHAFGYPVPHFRFGERLPKACRVFVLMDLYGSGLLMSNIRRALVRQDAKVVMAMSLIDAYGEAQRDAQRSNVALNLRASPNFECRSCRSGRSTSAIPLDAYTGAPFSVQTSAVKGAPDLIPSTRFWEVAARTNAVVEQHLEFNGSHVSTFIEPRKMFLDQEFLNEVASTVLQVAGSNIGAIVVPKNEGALILGMAVQALFSAKGLRPPELLPLVRLHRDNRFASPLRPKRPEQVLILDDSANTGSTLLGLHFAAQALRASHYWHIVIVDRLSGTARDAVMALLGKSYRPLIRLQLPLFTPWDCPLCLEAESEHLRQDHGDITEVAIRSAAPIPARGFAPPTGESK